MDREKKWFPKGVVSPLTVVNGDELSSTLVWSYEQPERDNDTI